MDDTTLAIVLWGATALLLGWTWIPALIAGLGGSRFQLTGSEDPTALQLTNAAPDYAIRYEQLTKLGYEPVGSATMRMNFHGSDWRHDFQFRVFWSRAKQTFAFLQKQPRPLDVWWLVSFATCWTDGGLLLTNNGSNEEPGEGDYIIQGIESDDLAAVESLHMSTRDRLVASGKRIERDGGLETLLTAIRNQASSAARYVAVKLGQTYLMTHAVLHVVLSLPIAFINGVGHWGVAMVNLVLGSLFALSEFITRRRAGEKLRSQIVGQLNGRRDT